MIFRLQDDLIFLLSYSHPLHTVYEPQSLRESPVIDPTMSHHLDIPANRDIKQK